MKPDMLLLDEPTTGLDEKTADRLVDVLGQIGLPYLIISHDREFLKRTTTRTHRLQNGRLAQLEPDVSG